MSNIVEKMLDVPAEHQSNVFGQFDSHIKKIEQTLKVSVIARDGEVKILGPADYTRQAARVIERSTSNWSRTLTLNKGTGLGVAIGDCVVDQYGYLVGVVTEAGANWCTVTTILDTDSQPGALVFRTGEVTVAMGDLALMGQGKLKLSYLEGESSLINGDMIVTSGLGGYYPSGLVIGSVEEIKTDDNGLTRYATIIPKTDITQLVEVFVITDFTIVD